MTIQDDLIFMNLYNEILSMEYIDSHSHLIEGSKWNSLDFNYIYNYHFINTLVKSSNISNNKDLSKLTFDEVFSNIKYTSFYWMLKKILNDLYEIKKNMSIAEIDEIISAKYEDINWPNQIINHSKNSQFIINRFRKWEKYDISEREKIFPRLDEYNLPEWLTLINNSSNNVYDRLDDKIEKDIIEYSKNNYKFVMMQVPGKILIEYTDDNIVNTNENDQYSLVFKKLCECLEKHKIGIQLFFGVDKYKNFEKFLPVTDKDRVIRLFSFFERYNIKFELFSASDSDNSAIILAAKTFKNVYAGALWWFNYTKSNIESSIRVRIEDLPINKSTIMITDTVSPDWMYGKALFIKKLLAMKLTEYMKEGYISFSDAVSISKKLLYQNPEKIYSDGCES